MPGSRRIATVLFFDVVGSTQVAAHLGDARYRELLSRFYRIVARNLKRFGGKEEDRARAMASSRPSRSRFRRSDALPR